MKLFPLALIAATAILFSAPAMAQNDAANSPPILSAGPPNAGTSEVQTLTIGGTPTGGSFKLSHQGYTTAAIPWSATNATLLASINSALDALPNLANGEVVATAGTLTAGIGTITLTFGGNSGKLAANTITVGNNSLTGTSPTLAIVKTTPGVNATGRNAKPGRLLIDTVNKKLYINTGTQLNPVWTVVGTQT